MLTIQIELGDDRAKGGRPDDKPFTDFKIPGTSDLYAMGINVENRENHPTRRQHTEHHQVSSLSRCQPDTAQLMAGLKTKQKIMNKKHQVSKVMTFYHGRII